jgi:hypothetical protein
MQSSSKSFGEKNGQVYQRPIRDSRRDQKVSVTARPPQTVLTGIAYAYRKTRMLTDEALTAGQRNSLATGNSLMKDRGKHAMVRAVLVACG